MRLFPHCVFLLCSLFLLACEEDLSAGDHLRRAMEFADKNNNQPAITELKLVLQQDAQNLQARTLLGKLYFEMGMYDDADKELSRVLDTGERTAEVAPILAQVLLGLGQYDRLDSLSLADLSSESRSTVQAAKGLSMMYRGNLVVAAELIDIALKNDTVSPYAQVAAARLKMEQRDYQEARLQLVRVFAVDQKYAPAWSLLGDIESATQNPKTAEIAYTRVIELSPNNFDALLNRAMMRIYQQNYAGASQDLGKIRKSFGPSRFHPGVNFVSGLIALQAKQLDRAMRSFQAASEFSDAYPQTLYYLAAIYLEKGLVEQALNTVNQFLGLVPDSVVGAKLAAKLELGQGAYSSAEKLLDPVVANQPEDVEALNLLASALLAQGKSGEGVDLLARVAQLQPDSKEAKARLGAGFIATGADELGVELLHQILKKDPKYEQADILIVLSYLHQGKFLDAIHAAEAYRARNPKSATSYDLLGRAFLANGQEVEAQTAFNKAFELRPGDPEAGSSLADLALQRKDYGLARNLYAQILKQNPDHLQTHLRMATAYALEGNEKQMLSTLDNAIATFPREMEPRLVKARYFIANGELDAAMLMLDQLSEEQKALPDALVTVAGFQLAAGRYNQALSTLSKLTDAFPDVSQYHYMKSKAYAGLGDTAQLMEELRRTVSLDPDHFYAKIALARLALLSNNAELFEKQFLELRKLGKDNPDVMKLEAMWAQQKGDSRTAERLLETLFTQEPSTGNAIALASYKQSRGDIQGAIEQLQHWVADHKDDIVAREKLAEIYGSNRQRGGVIYQYQQILKIDPDNAIALNNLAWNLLDENPQQALDYAEKALKLSPNSSSIHDTLAMAQLKNGRYIEARRSVDRALSLSPGRTELRLHQAQIRAAAGDSEGALKVLEAMLRIDGNFPERSEAEALLQQLKSR